MKLILALVFACLLACALSEVTLSSSANIITTIAASANSANSSNSDIVLKITTPSTIIGNDALNNLACVDMAVSSYTLTADGANLGTWAYTVLCGAACATIDILGTPIWYNGLSTFTLTGTVYAAAILAASTAKTPTIVSNTTTASAVFNTYTYTMTPTELAAYKLPNQTQTHYYRCFSTVDTTIHAFTSATTNLATSLTVLANATFKGSAASVAAVTALGASLLAAAAF